MSTLIPTHLQGYAAAVATESARRRVLTLHSSGGGSWFTVEYYGDVDEDHGVIIDVEGVPALVMVRAVDTGERFVLYDAGRHGFLPMFAEHHDVDVLNSRTVDKRVLGADGEAEFQVRIDLVDGIDWALESDRFRGEDGQVRLRNGETVDDRRLRADGFDAVAITLTGRRGTAQLVIAEGDLD